MAQRISTSAYTNRKGAERVGLQMSRADALALAGFGGEEAARKAQILVSEALIPLLTEPEPAQEAS